MLTLRFVQTRRKITLASGQLLLWLLLVARKVTRRGPLKGKYNGLLARLVQRTGLFDPEWYLEQNPDVVASSIQPLRHYVAYGDREGRSPMPLFSPQFYKSRADGRTKHINSLLHYYYIGRYRTTSPSSWFDLRYYLSNNKDVAKSGLEPLYHYLHYGGVEGRSPNPQFDGAWYLRSNPEVQSARVNPLVHYLRNGHYAGLPTRAANDAPSPRAAQKPWREIAETLKPLSAGGEPVVDIIVPVYKDQELTLRCIASVLQADYSLPVELTVINDASPEPELIGELEWLAQNGLVTLLTNSDNLGFVKSVNKGMALHPKRDVVLLNSDTEVYNDWLDRLHQVALGADDTATVTPLSNNATICSYPRFLHDNPYPLETPYPMLDRLAAACNQGLSAEAPTGVGFCMYIRRGALEDVGYFDEEAFGKGYGEENDFCQKAIRKGWKNLITAEVFVRHLGGASFLGEKGKRIANALTILAQRYPDYQQQVDDYIRRDPLQAARQNLDLSRLATFVREENILMVCHSRGGGAERHLQDDAETAMKSGKGVFIMRPERGAPGKVRIQHPKCRQLLNQPLLSLADTDKLAEALGELGITLINPHGMVDFSEDAPLDLQKLASRLNVPIQVDIHDYKVICPRINLADENGVYCGEPGTDACNQCLAARGNDFGATDIKRWRDIHGQVLRASEIVWVPDEDVAQRLSRYFPDVAYRVAPHDSISPPAYSAVKPIAVGGRLHIVVIGAISKLKGFNVLLACARDAQKRKLPLRFTVMGYSLNDALLREAGVEITGQYREQEAAAMLKSLQPGLIWLPSVWPETYSYTLSIALTSDCPVAAFDIGAIASRLRKLQRADYLIPLNQADHPEALNECFTRLMSETTSNTHASTQGFHETTR